MLSDDDLTKIDDLLNRDCRFMAAVIREHGIKVREQFEILTVNVFYLCGAVVLFALPVIAGYKRAFSGWTLFIVWIAWMVACGALSLFWQRQTTRITERTAEAERELWNPPDEPYPSRAERIAEIVGRK